MATVRIDVGAHAVAEKEYTNIRQHREYNAEDVQCVRVLVILPLLITVTNSGKDRELRKLLTKITNPCNTMKDGRCLMHRQQWFIQALTAERAASP